MRSVLPLIILLFLTPSSLCEDLKIVSFPKNKVASSAHTARIFGGATAQDGQFPYMVFFLYFMRQTGSVASCSASLVAEDKVLLAAHCFEGDANPFPEDVLAIAGKVDLVAYMTARRGLGTFYKNVDEVALGLQERRASSIFISPKYKKETLRHDVALFTVAKPFQLNSKVAVIPLAQDTITGRTTCTIQGWGLAEEDVRSYRLMYVSNVHALPLSECVYSKKDGPFVCLQKTNSGICQGDSGSPIVCNGKVYGVASHVLTDRHDAQCGDDLEEFYATLNQEQVWMAPFLRGHQLAPTFAPPSGPGQDDGSAKRGTATAHHPIFVLLISFIMFIARLA